VAASVHDLLSQDAADRARLDTDEYFHDLFDYDLDDTALHAASVVASEASTGAD
jgi:hypothetical protein